MNKETNKNQKQLDDFIEYCNKHPQERFWQCLRNWSETPFILKGQSFNIETRQYEDLKDTFYE